eukprot:4898113-Amphidinium_carterae.1
MATIAIGSSDSEFKMDKSHSTVSNRLPLVFRTTRARLPASVRVVACRGPAPARSSGRCLTRSSRDSLLQQVV